VFISSLIVITACSKNQETIKIGIAGTMSGINSDLSVSGRRGVELAADEFNKAGGLNGRKIELIVKDDKNNATIAMNIDKEFIDENIAVVIGHYTSGMMVESMDYLKDKEILFLAPTISVDILSGMDDNFIRFISTTTEQAVALAKEANKNNNEKFAVIYDLKNIGFCEVLNENFKKLLEESGGKVVLTKTFTSDVNGDYLSLANAIKESMADGVLIIANSADNAEITQQIRKVGSNIQIYSPLWSNTTELMKKGGTAVEGMIIVGAIDLDNNKKDFIEFKTHYIDTYGEDPTFSSMYSYEATQALFQAMRMGPDFKPNTIKKNIIKIMNFKGLEGDYVIDKFGDNIREYMLFKLAKGQLRKVD